MIARSGTIPNPTVGSPAQLVVKVTPNARASAVTGWGSDTNGRRALLIRLAAPATEGKANRELVRFLAELLDCPRTSLRVLRGQTSRTKVVEMPADAAARLG